MGRRQGNCDCGHGNVGLSGELSAPTGVITYERLIHKPSIGGVELIGDKPLSAFGVPEIYYGTTAEWDAQHDFKTRPGVVYVYTDAVIESDTGRCIPAIKLGDGAYLVDLPFVGVDNRGVEQALEAHVSDNDVHVTPAEKAFWNGKHKAVVEGENLIFTIN